MFNTSLYRVRVKIDRVRVGKDRVGVKLDRVRVTFDRVCKIVKEEYRNGFLFLETKDKRR